MPEDSFKRREGMRVSQFNNRRPYLADSVDGLEGIIQEVESVAAGLGLQLKRVYEGKSFSLRKGDEPARQEPFMVDRWALAGARGVRHAVSFVIRGESQEAKTLRSWFTSKQLERESSLSSEGKAEAYSFIVSPQVTVSDSLDI